MQAAFCGSLQKKGFGWAPWAANTGRKDGGFRVEGRIIWDIKKAAGQPQKGGVKGDRTKTARERWRLGSFRWARGRFFRRRELTEKQKTESWEIESGDSERKTESKRGESRGIERFRKTWREKSTGKEVKSSKKIRPSSLHFSSERQKTLSSQNLDSYISTS